MDPQVRASTPASKPGSLNVLLLFADDLRPALGCYGDFLAKTPHIDRFALTARVFTRAYCQQAVCGPSRAAVLTGRLPDNTGTWHNRNRFRETQPDLVTLPQLFHQQGWWSVSLGKIFSGDERELDPASWSEPEILRPKGWRNRAVRGPGDNPGKGAPSERADVPDDAYPDGRLAQLAVDTLTRLAGRPDPFFLAVGFFRPHLPWAAPARYWDLHDPSSFASSGPDSRARGAPDVAYPDHLELAGYQDVPPDERLSPEQTRDLRHAYYASVSFVDAQVGKVLDALDRLGLSERTVVVLLGDHGYSLGEGGHWCKDTNFERDTHVPLLIRKPGLTGGPTSALTELVDLYPTLAELAGLRPLGPLEGRSLVPQLENPATPGARAVLSQFSRPFRGGTPEVMGYSLRTETRRYTRWIDWKTREPLFEELYDYGDSASVHRGASVLIETANVAGDPARGAMRHELSAQLDEQLRRRCQPVTLESPSRRSRRNREP